jgi:uncharacterized protein YqiB (DUF1249 family)
LALCEENFHLLSRLAPQLRTRRGPLVSRVKDGVDLHLSIEEQARYTTLLRLTYLFADGAGGNSGLGADPDARLRVYHDARQVELLDLRQTALPRLANYQAPALVSKWRANLFLWKWLAYCLHQGHRFGSETIEVPFTADGDLLFSCI